MSIQITTLNKYYDIADTPHAQILYTFTENPDPNAIYFLVLSHMRDQTSSSLEVTQENTIWTPIKNDITGSSTAQALKIFICKNYSNISSKNVYLNFNTLSGSYVCYFILKITGLVKTSNLIISENSNNIYTPNEDTLVTTGLTYNNSHNGLVLSFLTYYMNYVNFFNSSSLNFYDSTTSYNFSSPGVDANNLHIYTRPLLSSDVSVNFTGTLSMGTRHREYLVLLREEGVEGISTTPPFGPTYIYGNKTLGPLVKKTNHYDAGMKNLIWQYR